jgi:hypothetical protein
MIQNTFIWCLVWSEILASWPRTSEESSSIDTGGFKLHHSTDLKNGIPVASPNTPLLNLTAAPVKFEKASPTMTVLLNGTENSVNPPTIWIQDA